MVCASMPRYTSVTDLHWEFFIDVIISAALWPW